MSIDVGKNDFTTGRQSVTAAGIMAYWRAVGGHNYTAMIAAVAIAIATSNGDTGYVNGNRVGLWGIEPSEAGHPTRPNAHALLNPKTNAGQAWAISNQGTTWRDFPAAFDGSTYLGPNAPFRAQLDKVMKANGAPGLTAAQAKTWPDSNAFGRAQDFTPGGAAGVIASGVADSVTALPDAVANIGKVLNAMYDVIRWFTSPAHLWRVAQFLMGMGMIFVGGMAIIKDSPVGQVLKENIGSAAKMAAFA